MCKAVLKEHHRHTIVIAIMKAKVEEMDGVGADATRKEKVIANCRVISATCLRTII